MVRLDPPVHRDFDPSSSVHRLLLRPPPWPQDPAPLVDFISLFMAFQNIPKLPLTTQFAAVASPFCLHKLLWGHLIGRIIFTQDKPQLTFFKKICEKYFKENCTRLRQHDKYCAAVFFSFSLLFQILGNLFFHLFQRPTSYNHWTISII